MSVSAAARNRRQGSAVGYQSQQTYAIGYNRSSYAYAAVARRPLAPPRPALSLPSRPLMIITGAVVLLAVLTNLFMGLLAGHGVSAGHWSDYRPARGPSPLTLVAGIVSPLAPPVVAAVEAATAPPPAPAAPPAQSGDRPSVGPPTPDHNLIAPPSIDAATLDRVLQQYNSPAAGQGATFYDLGVKYGIDPAYALAFYIHESSAGTKGVARFTKSIGNIRTTAGYRDYEGYRAYDTWAASIEDWYKLIKDLYVDGWGKRTVAQIIPTYAPVGDNNDPSSYIASVTNLVDSWQQK